MYWGKKKEKRGGRPLKEREKKNMNSEVTSGPAWEGQVSPAQNFVPRVFAERKKRGTQIGRRNGPGNCAGWQKERA